MLHSGGCTIDQVRAWVINRYAYQSHIPLKDAAFLSRCADPDMRRVWRSRIEDHDGDPDPATGRPAKTVYGPWMMRVFPLLAGLKGLRGTAFDIFGRSAERRMERRLITDYESLLDELAAGLTPATHPVAVALAAIPEKIRGYGPVKERNLETAKAEEAALLEAFRSGGAPERQAAE